MNDHSESTSVSPDADKDYGFLEEDFSTRNPENSAEAITGNGDQQAAPGHKQNEEPLRADPRESDLLRAELESPDQEIGNPKKAPAGLTKNEKIKYGLIIGGVGVLILGVLGWLAYGFMNPHPASTKRKSFDFEEHAIRPGSVTTEPQIEATPRRVQGAINGATSQPLAEHESDQKGAFSVAPVRTSQEDEDEFYDNMAKVAGQQQIQAVEPTNVVSSQQQNQLAPQQVDLMANNQFGTINQDLKKNSAQLLQVMDALAKVSSEVASLKSQVQNDSEQNRKYGTQIEGLSEKLAAFTVKSDERFKAITSDAVAAAIAAVKKQSSPSGAGNGKMVLVGGPKIPTKTVDKAQNRDMVQTRSLIKNPAPANAAINSSMPSTGHAVQNSSLGGDKQVAACGAKAISQNWNVKGVSASAAYIRRTDGEGVMVRVDMEVPGFGTVKSFDPNARTVCTTSGLIVR
ncbi:hypothetical protein ACEN2T_17575 [Pseudomonas sp. W22_MBD1_FP4]|uniref:hypothetical protein n=1 Tax=Pseudomonas sp. W22_MBD1_FP4 TaxID=3240272 RepID=UPI003F96E022